MVDCAPMITRSLAQAHTPQWQQELAQAIRDPALLWQALELDATSLPAAYAAAGKFPLLVPLPYLARMRRGDPTDPLLRQVLPLDHELRDVAGFVCDPVGDLAAQVAPGVLHKYRGRVLLTATGACAVHCRYCFRRHFPYAATHDDAQFSAAIAYIAAHTDVHEVILSGGDPLTLSDRKLGNFVTAVAALPHVQRLRIHTRVPVVLPSRIDDALATWMQDTRLQIVVVLHVNHAREIDAAVIAACARLRALDVTLLNQSVLLAGVNDDVETLAELSEALFAAGVLPYYLHVLDRVAGAAHFDVPTAHAQHLHRGLQARLPGYLVPRLVREQAGAEAKLWI